MNKNDVVPYTKYSLRNNNLINSKKEIITSKDNLKSKKHLNKSANHNFKEDVKFEMNVNQHENDYINIDAMTYDQLLELENIMGKVSKGLNKSQIDVIYFITLVNPIASF